MAAMPEHPLKIALIVGEDSGDQLGAGLIDAIRARHPQAQFIGVAGERMIARNMPTFFPVADVSVMGLSAVIGRLPTILRHIRRTARDIVAARPDILVIIDSPGFTHSVAKRVARRLPDLPIVDYVSPSVWAWKPWRARHMAQIMEHVLALLPFEPAVHERLGGPPCTYVGHPLIERLDDLRPASGERPPLSAEPTLLVLPGSRKSEIRRLMAPFGAALAELAAIRARSDLAELKVVLPAVAHLSDEIAARAATWPVEAEIVVGEAAKFAAFRGAHAALAASGTVTLELALSGVPMVVAYRVDILARMLKWLVNVPSIVLANLVIGENIVPEFIDGDGSPAVLARELAPLLDDTEVRARQLAGFSRLDGLMTLPDGLTPSQKAASVVLDIAAGRGDRGAAVGADVHSRLDSGT
jgi:lipid-A-disaccharide synthase